MITLLVIMLVVNGGLPGMEKQVADDGGAVIRPRVMIRVATELAADPAMNPVFIAAGDHVELQLPGDLYTKPLVVPQTRSVDMSTPEQATFTTQGALALGDTQSIISLYSIEERRSVKASLDDHNTRARMFLRPEASSRLTIHGVLYYGSYALVLARYSNDPTDSIVLPFISERGRWMRTNALLGDPVYDHVLKAWVLGGIATGGATQAVPADLPPMIPMMP